MYSRMIKFMLNDATLRTLIPVEFQLLPLTTPEMKLIKIIKLDTMMMPFSNLFISHHLPS
jgi:hypothetical protein